MPEKCLTMDNIDKYIDLLELSEGPSNYGLAQKFDIYINDGLNLLFPKRELEGAWMNVECPYGLSCQEQPKNRPPLAYEEMNFTLWAHFNHNSGAFRNFAVRLQEKMIDLMTVKSPLWTSDKRQLTREETAKCNKHKVVRAPKNPASKDKYGERWGMGIAKNVKDVRKDVIVYINGQNGLYENGTLVRKYNIQDLFDMNERRGKGGLFTAFWHAHLSFKPGEDEWLTKFEIYATDLKPKGERVDPFGGLQAAEETPKDEVNEAIAQLCDTTPEQLILATPNGHENSSGASSSVLGKRTLSEANNQSSSDSSAPPGKKRTSASCLNDRE